MDRWQEHLPIASASLRSTYTRVAPARVQFSSAERALFTACEFWAAVRSRKLAPHLGVGPIDALRYASILYAPIRADNVAADLIAAIGELTRASGPQEQHQCLAKLQERLLRTRDPVDQLIGRLAETLGWGPASSLRDDFPQEATALPAPGRESLDAPALTGIA